MNNLICYEINNKHTWNMVPDSDRNAFLMELMQTSGVNLDSIFIVPTGSILGGIWLFPDSHKSDRVDFWNFQEDYGQKYTPVQKNETTEHVLSEIEKEKDRTVNSKYGFISPDGRYFHCDFQGHYNLASKICFGLIETSNPERYLEDHGWCKIYNPISSNSRYDIYVGENHVITDAQMKTLIHMGLDHTPSLSDMLRKRDKM